KKRVIAKRSGKGHPRQTRHARLEMGTIDNSRSGGAGEQGGRSLRNWWSRHSCLPSAAYSGRQECLPHQTITSIERITTLTRSVSEARSAFTLRVGVDGSNRSNKPRYELTARAAGISGRFHRDSPLQSEPLHAHLPELEFLNLARHRGRIFVHES